MKTVMIALAALTLAACNTEVVDPAPVASPEAPAVDTSVVDTDERVCGNAREFSAENNCVEQ